MAVEHLVSTCLSSRGCKLAVQDWPQSTGQALRGQVLLLHGLGEHMGRYQTVARRLNAWGFAVRAYDQYGHGDSDGPRGGLDCDTGLIDDLATLIDHTRASMTPGKPLILLGHSMGALVAAHFVALGIRPVDALVLSSPAFDPGLNLIQKLLLAVLPAIMPNFRVSNGLNAALISHNPAVVAAYCTDPKVHNRICARLARFIASTGPATVTMAPNWCVPTLLLYAGSDKLVNPAGSKAFAAAAPREVVSVRCFEPLYHEIFNELDPQPVFAELKRWLDARF